MLLAIIFFHFAFSALSFLCFVVVFLGILYIYQICIYVCAYACTFNYIHNCILQAPRKEWSKQSSDKTEGTDFSSVFAQRSHHSFYKERRADFGMVRDPRRRGLGWAQGAAVLFSFLQRAVVEGCAAKQGSICWRG